MDKYTIDFTECKYIHDVHQAITIDELTIDDIIIIANRYSIGPDHDISKATKHDYGYRIINEMEMLLELLE